MGKNKRSINFEREYGCPYCLHNDEISTCKITGCRYKEEFKNSKSYREYEKTHTLPLIVLAEIGARKCRT